jgi:hypothetical protein
MAKVSDYAEYTKSLVGYSEGLLIAFPPVNADGTPNQEAQDKAVQGVIAALSAAGCFSIPGATADKVASLGKDLVLLIQDYKTATRKSVL